MKGIHCIKKNKLKDSTIIVLDIRDYNETSKYPEDYTLNIPFAYLKRFYMEIPQGKIHVIAEDKLELNLGLRFLIKKGFSINSFELTKYPCTVNQKKRMLDHGV
ncbi:sulfurtransferase [Peribacillus frigoritolerans]|uniref:sulfurtransferase n=1 Tax=Peribacillus frigoritolerans TaxID=450367 RepID=UPI0022278AF1|nr:sulfurtransferase [Peribacillus frigoritolerans]UYY96822.1 sulfurtransferase [Peribacillus frigoritolerans]